MEEGGGIERIKGDRKFKSVIPMNFKIKTNFIFKNKDVVSTSGFYRCFLSESLLSVLF